MNFNDLAPYLIGPAVGVAVSAGTSALSSTASLRRRLAADIGVKSGMTGTARALLGESIDRRGLQLVAAVEHPRFERSDTPAFVVMFGIAGWSAVAAYVGIVGPYDPTIHIMGLAAAFSLAFSAAWPLHLMSRRAGARLNFVRSRLSDTEYLGEVRTLQMWSAVIAFLLGGSFLAVVLASAHGLAEFQKVPQGAQGAGAFVISAACFVGGAGTFSKLTDRFWDDNAIPYEDLLRAQRPGRLEEFQALRDASVPKRESGKRTWKTLWLTRRPVDA